MRLWPAFSFSLRRTALRTGGLVVDGADTVYGNSSWAASAACICPCSRRRSRANVSFGYDYIAYGPADPLPITCRAKASCVRPSADPMRS